MRVGIDVFFCQTISDNGMSTTEDHYTSLWADYSNENLNFIYVGNLQDRATFSTRFIHFEIHEIPPYPLPDMCSKCEKINVMFW